MNRASIESIQSAIHAARQLMRTVGLDGCDIDDVEDVILPVEAELKKPLPNSQTLATYLNSLARSLRSYGAAREVCKQLDAAMREAGLPTDWEH